MKVIFAWIASLLLFLHLSPASLPNTNIIGPTTTPTITPEPTLIAVPAVSPPPGWQIYSNPIYKYTLAYPPDWTLQTTAGHLSISLGATSWVFIINPDPAELSASPGCDPAGSCSITHAPLTVMHYATNRLLVRRDSDSRIISAYLVTPSQSALSHPGFGQTGSGDIRYWVAYQGPDISRYLATMDTMTSTLAPLP